MEHLKETRKQEEEGKEKDKRGAHDVLSLSWPANPKLNPVVLTCWLYRKTRQ